jgi:hypothetical protein
MLLQRSVFILQRSVFTLTATPLIVTSRRTFTRPNKALQSRLLLSNTLLNN